MKNKIVAMIFFSTFIFLTSNPSNAETSRGFSRNSFNHISNRGLAHHSIGSYRQNFSAHSNSVGHRANYHFAGLNRNAGSYNKNTKVASVTQANNKMNGVIASEVISKNNHNISSLPSSYDLSKTGSKGTLELQGGFSITKESIEHWGTATLSLKNGTSGYHEGNFNMMIGTDRSFEHSGNTTVNDFFDPNSFYHEGEIFLKSGDTENVKHSGKAGHYSYGYTLGSHEGNLELNLSEKVFYHQGMTRLNKDDGQSIYHNGNISVSENIDDSDSKSYSHSGELSLENDINSYFNHEGDFNLITGADKFFEHSGLITAGTEQDTREFYHKGYTVLESDYGSINHSGETWYYNMGAMVLRHDGDFNLSLTKESWSHSGTTTLTKNTKFFDHNSYEQMSSNADSTKNREHRGETAVYDTNGNVIDFHDGSMKKSSTKDENYREHWGKTTLQGNNDKSLYHEGNTSISKNSDNIIELIHGGLTKNYNNEGDVVNFHEGDAYFKSGWYGTRVATNQVGNYKWKTLVDINITDDGVERDVTIFPE